MKSLKRHEGYLLIDNRVSEGVPDNIMLNQGLPPGAGRGLYEAATYTCNHCDSVVVMNSLRTRERGYCRGCDHYICDACNAIKAKTMTCKPMAKIVDEVLAQVTRSST